MDYEKAKLRTDLDAWAGQTAALLARVEALERQVAAEMKARLDREAAEQAERERLQREADEKVAAEAKAAAEVKAAEEARAAAEVKPAAKRPFGLKK